MMNLSNYATGIVDENIDRTDLREVSSDSRRIR